MKKYELIQVLWVEDDPNVTESYPLLAERKYGLQLVAYPCWDDAKKALENEYDRWSAIILDAKCKFHKDSVDNANEFLSEALGDITGIASDKHRTIPWYILTGGDTSEISYIRKERLNWDDDWTKSKNKDFYSKNTDCDDLFHRIQIHANKSPRLLIHEMYREVFDAIEECEIDDEAYNLLEDLLILIHFPNETPDVGFLNVRKIMEYIYKSMGIWGILPKNKKVNLRWSSILLGGENAIKPNGQIVYKYKGEKLKIVPKIIHDFMKVIIDTVSTEMHANSEDSIYEKADIPSYLPLVDNSTYLLKSYTFQLCDIILWYRNYLKNHQDIEQNKKNWEFVSK